MMPRRRLRLSAVRVVVKLTVYALTLVAFSHRAPAMEFSTKALPRFPDKLIVAMTGPIRAGDDARFRAFMQGFPPDQRVAAFDLDSGGGNLLEAERMAARLRIGGAAVVVRGGETCASACFLMFAAGKHRFADPHASIGVHSAASRGGREDEAALAATTLMARDAAEYGVPASIIGKLVTTQSRSITWLKVADMDAMGVVVFSAQESAALGSVATTPAVDAVAVSVSDPRHPRSAAEAYAAGRRDRLAWNIWLNGLPDGPFREGAQWWNEARGEPAPGSCVVDRAEAASGDGGSADAGSATWAGGCDAARVKLAAADARRRAEPDYSRGWNSL